METIQKSIEVDLPIGSVYNQWTQFEDFPKFMEGVKEVRQLSPHRLYWRAEIFGKEKEWESQIDEQVPDQRIIWSSTVGASSNGAVHFERLEENRTRVSLMIHFEPQSALAKIGEDLVSSRIQGDLERFKDFIEKRGAEIGAWRGQVEHGRVKTY